MTNASQRGVDVVERSLSAGHLEGKLLKGTYQVEQRVARGGMAWVYRATHVTLGVQVAIKILFDEYTVEETVAQRFLNEAKIQFTIRHPHVVQVMDVIDEGGVLGMVMEWIDGQDLKEWLRGQPRVTFPQLWGLLSPILDAMDHIHKQDMVHRDLKPANILLNKEAGGLVPKVADFGIAKLGKSTEEGMTRTGSHMGTVRYMSPEQIQDTKRVDGRSDVYALGIIIYEMLAGRAPFVGEVHTVMFKHISADVPPLHEYRNDIPEGLEQLLQQTLDKDRDKRTASCAVLKASLHRVLSEAIGEPIEDATAREDLLSPTALPASSMATPVEQPLPSAITMLTEEREQVKRLSRQRDKGISSPMLVGLAALCLVSGMGLFYGLYFLSKTPKQEAGTKPNTTQQEVLHRPAPKRAETRTQPAPVRERIEHIRPPARPRALITKTKAQRHRRRRRRIAYRRRVRQRRTAPPVRRQPAPSTIQVTLLTRPSGAKVLLGGQVVGRTPYRLTGKAGALLNLTLQKDKYETKRVKLRLFDGMSATRQWTLRVDTPNPFGRDFP